VRKFLRLKNTAAPKTSTWIEAYVIQQGGFLSWNQSTSLGDLDRLLVLTRIMGELETDDPFVFNYWDLRPQNILVDSQHNVVGYECFVRSVQCASSY
jgi:hypothetical protein